MKLLWLLAGLWVVGVLSVWSTLVIGALYSLLSYVTSCVPSGRIGPLELLSRLGELQRVDDEQSSGERRHLLEFNV